ncbi:glycosyltransferase [Roseivirga pacifica]|nr:glycosyltransferase [Roseivirga pacifica]MCO6368965.1 glycosyltransferase [Roseivirga pacifica]MCO6372331.1 glycosyltransferase [Roseivirga pacifica]MCO6374141.1 glycosyltransferase [Roseivirga pacifica]MCO6381062.1 glycosyltransferase [Roseivirga pacifica]
MSLWLFYFFLLLMVVQLRYLLTLSVSIFSLKMPKSNTQQPVSVIIAARNEAHNLANLLAKLSEQDHPEFEVIVVNDRSFDNTKEILAKAEALYNFLKVITISEKPANWNGKKYALKKAVEAAKYDALLFTDADCLPKSKKWVTEITAGLIEQKQVIIGFSPYAEKPGLLNKFIRFETLFTALNYLGFAALNKPYMGVGRNMVINKTVYDIKFLNEISDLTGGDDDLMVQKVANRQNTCVVISSDSQTISEPKLTWREFFKQKIRHLGVGKYYRQKDKTVLGFFSFSYVVGWATFILLCFSQTWIFTLVIFGIRSLSFYVIFSQLGRKLKAGVPFWALPALDFCYPCYYLLIGLRALSPKGIEWKQESSFLKKH